MGKKICSVKSFLFLFISRCWFSMELLFSCDFWVLMRKYEIWVWFCLALSFLSASFHIERFASLPFQELGFQDYLIWPCVLKFLEINEGDLRFDWLSLSIFQLSVSLFSWNSLLFLFLDNWGLQYNGKRLYVFKFLEEIAKGLVSFFHPEFCFIHFKNWAFEENWF